MKPWIFSRTRRMLFTLGPGTLPGMVLGSGPAPTQRQEGPVFPIVTSDALPQPGASSELPSLDFKRTGDPTATFEMAKDVAALANTTGGSILIGALADGQRLIRYDGIPEPLAKRLGEAYERAVKDLCRPTPYLETCPLFVNAATLVLAVNVWMSPVAPVGIRVREAKVTDESWAFPRRVGSQTQYLQPDQFGALENMTTRRAAALLLGIPEVQRREICISAIQNGSPPNLQLFGRLDTVSLEWNVASFMVGPDPRQPVLPLRVPLDWVLTVWRDTHHNLWEVVLDEHVFVRREEDQREWVVAVRK